MHSNTGRRSSEAKVTHLLHHHAPVLTPNRYIALESWKPATHSTVAASRRVGEHTAMQTRVREILFQLCRDEEGPSLVEYILLVALIGTAAIVGMPSPGKTANNRLNNVTDAIK